MSYELICILGDLKMTEKSKRNILITGGEFNNKGAQSMSFITISRIKSHFPNHNIIMGSVHDAAREKGEIDIYNFDLIPDPLFRNNFIGEEFIRKVLNKSPRKNPRDYRNILDKTDYIFDISGYALSSQFGVRKSRNYLKKFKLAHQKGIKTVILPQSIGPFDYDKSNSKMKREIYDTLSKVDIIMPREFEGVNFLNELGLKDNVFYSPDLVLTNKKNVNWDFIYKNKIVTIDFDILENSVALVPNMRNFDHGNKNQILDLYKAVIEDLLQKKFNVYLIRHSGEDLEVCKMIKNMFSNIDNVKVICDDLTPSDFQKLTSQFEFSIGSRFHSVVHSFKVGTPCIILGWATKYKELAEIFTQSDYVFDVRNEINISVFIEMMNQLISNLPEEKSKIQEGLDKVEYMEDPFDKAFKIISEG